MNLKNHSELLHAPMYEYEPLRAAILRQAVKDYKSALKQNNQCEIAKLESFFLGEWGQLLSYGHGEYIIDTCKRIVNKKQKIQKSLDN